MRLEVEQNCLISRLYTNNILPKGDFPSFISEFRNPNVFYTFYLPFYHRQLYLPVYIIPSFIDSFTFLYTLYLPSYTALLSCIHYTFLHGQPYLPVYIISSFIDSFTFLYTLYLSFYHRQLYLPVYILPSFLP